MDKRRLRAGIIGAGFMGRVHAAAVRACGSEVSVIAAGSPESARHAADAMWIGRPAASARDLIKADDIDVVHICTPNSTHAELTAAALNAGKHVVCEKPLATSIEAAQQLTELAATSGLTAAVPFVYRYFPMVREARARIRAGEAGELHLLHGSYLQDWLAGGTDNWRVDPERGGVSRAFGDIGVHWCDLMEFVTGHRIIELVARTRTVEPQRAGKIVHTEDVVVVMFETDRGASGSVVISQVSLGHKNQLRFWFDGTLASLWFDQESPDQLWVGGRESTALVPRAEHALSADAKLYARLPAGHPQGYQDAFNAFVADVYNVIGGAWRDGMATFADGLRATTITAAVIESAQSGNWVKVAT